MAPHQRCFSGGGPGVADRLAETLKQQRHGVCTVGTYSPPFRPFTQEEKMEVDGRIEAAAPDVVRVGLSTPEQERWMVEHRDRLGLPVLLGVGAAFDFYTGRVAQAPTWMGDPGQEWLFRLSREPGRLWRHYLVYGGEFAVLVLLEISDLKKLTQPPCRFTPRWGNFKQYQIGRGAN